MAKTDYIATFGKVPPQDVDLEKIILGSLMLDMNCVAIGMSRLFEDIFYLDAHKSVFTAIQRVYDKNIPVDMMNVIDQLRKDETLELIGGLHYITKLTRDVSSGANIESHIAIISEKYLRRKTIEISAASMESAYSDSDDIWDNISLSDAAMQKAQENILTGSSKDIAYFGSQVLQSHAMVKETGVLGISTGIEELDKQVCGLVAPDLIIIAARPGQGKTALALSITHNTSILNNEPCAWFSLEMDGEQLVRRLASIDSGIDHTRLRNGQTSIEEEKMLNDSINKISKCKIFIEDKANANIRSIKTRSILLKKKHKIKFIVVDYLQLMSGTETKGQSRENIISEISRGLKCIAKDLGIPVVALSQLSREVEKRPDKMPQLSDLRESGAIEQDADGVWFLMRPEYYKMTEPVTIGGKEYDVHGLCILNSGKNRHGATGYVPIKFTGHTMKFSGTKNDFHVPGFVAITKGMQMNPDRNITTGDKLGPKDDLPF